MNTTKARLGAAAAATAMIVGLSALPAGAGDISSNIIVTGEAACDTATGTWSIEWTVFNDELIPANGDVSLPAGIEFPFLTATIEDAVMSGAATGTVADLVGDSVGPQQSTSAVVTGIPNATGDVTLTVDFSWSEGEFMASSSGDVTLDGSCTPPPTTSAPTTTTAVAADAVAARPAFTG